MPVPCTNTMKTFIFILFLINVLTSTYLFAEDVVKTKTFDSDRIIDYTFEYKHGSQVYRLFYTYDKNTNTAGIKYSPDNHFIQFNDLKPILLRLIQKAEAHDRGKLNYFMTFEYLGCDDLYMKSIRAFHKQKNWEEYLAASKKRWTTPPYELIKGRIISKDVFSELAPLFSEIGYEIRFSSYEKLAVQKAGEFDFYNDLKQYGIQPNDKFPVPLILYFSLKSGE